MMNTLARGICLLGLFIAAVLIGRWSFQAPHETKQPLFALPAVSSVQRIPFSTNEAKSTNRLALHHRISDAPAWVVPYGAEFWKTEGAAGKIASQRTPGSVAISEAIERVTHAFSPAPDGVSAATAGHGYRATVGIEGLTMSISNPESSSDLQKAGQMPAIAALLRTTLVRRGEVVVYATQALSPAWSVLGNTAQTLLNAHAQAVQHLQTGSRGVETSWVFAQSPEGSGPLEIELEIAGLKNIASTSSGGHYADGAGIARLCVGPAKAVDSQGRIWPVETILLEDRMRFVASEAVLAQAIYPLAIDPLISPESGVDNPMAGPSLCAQFAPVAAFHAGACLVVWTRGQSDYTPPAVMGARLNADGALLDPFGMMLGGTAAENTITAVAANDSGFLVIWSGPKGVSTTDWDIFGAFVGSDGTITAVPALCQATGVQSCPALGASRTNFFAAWHDSRNTGIYGTLVQSNGVALNPGGLSLTSAANLQFAPTVAALNGRYFVAWQDYRNSTASQFQSDIYGTRISPEGQILDAKGIALCTRTNSQWTPVAIDSGTNYLVIWEDYNVDGNDLFMARVSLDGTLLDTNAIALCQAGNAQSNPSAASDGTNTFVVWLDYRNSSYLASQADIYGARIDTNAVLLDGAGILISQAAAGQWHPSATATDQGFLAVWQDFRSNPGSMRGEIYSKLLTTAGEMKDSSRLVSQTANLELAPVVCAGASNYWVAWSDNRNFTSSGFDIYGMRLDGDGRPMDLDAIPICTAAANQTVPALAANGDGCMVVWADYRNASTNADIYGAWLDNSGAAKTSPFIVCAADREQNAPSIGAMNDQFLIVWQDARRSQTNAVQWDIYGVRATVPGIVLDGFPICTNSQAQIAPAVASSLNQWLVVWEDKRNGSTLDIYGARVDAGGVVLEPDGFIISSAVSNQSAPAVAGNESGFFVAWTDQRTTATGLDIYGARLDADGKVLDPAGIAVRSAPQYQSAPAIAINGRDFIIAWQGALNRNTNDYNLSGTIVNASGQAEKSWLANTNAFDQLTPSLASFEGRLLMISQAPRELSARAVIQRIVLEPRLGGARLSDGSFQYTVNASPGQRIAIEVSDDLVRWTPSVTFTNNLSGVMPMTESPNSNTIGRFYRAVVLP
jgi:hypothetical protein